MKRHHISGKRETVADYHGPCGEKGCWSTLPPELLIRVLSHLGAQPDGPHKDVRSTWGAVRAACCGWRAAVDGAVTALELSGWPSSRAFARHGWRANLSSLRLQHLPFAPQLASSNALKESSGSYVGDQGGGAAAVGPSRPMNLLRPSRQLSGSCVDLLAALALEPPRHAPAQYDHDLEEASDSSSEPLEAHIRSANQPSCEGGDGRRTPLQQPLPPPPPSVAAQSLWEALCGLSALRELSLSGAMLSVTAVQSSTTKPALRAAAAPLLSAATMHTYSLSLPDIVTRLTGLQALDVEWRLPGPCTWPLAPEHVCPSSDTDSIGTEPSSSATAAATLPAHSGGVSSQHRRRSYEPTPCPPDLLLAAAPRITLPPCGLGGLEHLTRLRLAGDVVAPDALLGLAPLLTLRCLELGPGQLNMCALLPLAGPPVHCMLAGLTRLALHQSGAWQTRALAIVLAGMPALAEWEVAELEQCDARSLPSTAAAAAALTAAPALILDDASPLTEADTAPLSGCLTRLVWTTCAQRLCEGASLLGASVGAAAAAATTPPVACWLGGLCALRELIITGTPGSLPALGPASLDALPASLACCTGLRLLHVLRLGVPLLPPGVGRLPLVDVRVKSSVMAPRRTLMDPDAALAALAGCSRLTRLELVGCELRGVPAWLARLPRLRTLHLASNYIQELPAAAGCCCRRCCCCFSAATTAVCGLPVTLTELDLRDNRLRELDGRLAGLQRLAVLTLDGNYLGALPPSLWSLPALTRLSAADNMLHLLPELPSAGWSLTCQQRNAEDAPSGVSRLTHSHSRALQAAAMWPDASVVAAPAAAGSDAATSTDALVFADRMGILSRRHSEGSGTAPAQSASGHGMLLPRRRASCSGAEGCSAASSSAASATAAGGCCASETTTTPQSLPPPGGSLRVLCLAGNQLASLPTSFSRLQALQTLDLSGNQLRSLPESSGVFLLRRLSCLSLARNHLRRLPAAISKMRSLQTLDVSGNQLTGPLAESSYQPRGSRLLAASSARYDQHRQSSSGVCSSFCNGGGGDVGGGGAHLRAVSLSMLSPLRLLLLPGLRWLLKDDDDGQQSTDALGGKAAAGHATSRLSLLLASLGELLELLPALMPPPAALRHRCPIREAALAAMAQLSALGEAACGAANNRSGQEQKRQQQQQCFAPQVESGCMAAAAAAPASSKTSGVPAVCGGVAAVMAGATHRQAAPQVG